MIRRSFVISKEDLYQNNGYTVLPTWKIQIVKTEKNDRIHVLNHKQTISPELYR